jgi:hypothetical protein
MSYDVELKGTDFCLTNPFLASRAWLDYCDKEYQNLLHEQLPTSNANQITAKPQRTWDMRHPPSSDHGALEEQEFDQAYLEAGFDYLAWYQPLHTSSLDDYGICFPLSGIVQLAEKLKIRIGGESCLSNRQLLYFSAHVLFLHELCHAYIERLVYAMEGFCGENDQRYIEATENFGTILMEEALCNTCITTQLKDLLSENTNDEMQPILDNFSVIYSALLEFMKDQPNGYKNLIDLSDNTDENEALFAANCQALLSHIYDIDIDVQHLGFKLIDPGDNHCDFERSYFKKTVFSQSHIPWHVSCHFFSNANQSQNIQKTDVFDIRHLIRLGYLEFCIGEKNYYSVGDLQGVKNLPNIICGTLICNDIGLESLDEFEGLDINGDFYCRNNRLKNLSKIDNHIKSINGLADFRGNPIVSSVLGVFKINDLRGIFISNKEFFDINSILNKWLPGKKHIANCQTELFKNGLKAYAKY